MKKIEFTPKQMEYIIENYFSGAKSIKALCEEFNCSRSTIERRLKENGITLKAKYPYQDLTGNVYGKLTVLGVNQERYDKDVQKTNKPHRYWFCLCECGRITEVESSHLKNGHTISCGCIKSKGELKITQLLQEAKLDFASEVHFQDLRGYGNGFLRFDFGILENEELKYLIEYNGKQHYQKTDGWCTQKEFEIRQFNDKVKIDYCKDKNIPLIIIPYTHFKDLSVKDLQLETSTFVV